jgi:cell wall-associated NlpC family hydrolase
MLFARPSVSAACPQPARPALRTRGALTLASVALAAAGAVGGLAGTASAAPASAAVTAHHASTPRSANGAHHAVYARHRAEWDAESKRVIDWARKQKGKPYSYGAAGPHAFDCSGLVMYVFNHAIHRSLPHNAAEQYHAVKHIRRSKLKPGDLIFVDNGGYISHVGIFAGHGYWWVAPHTGERVHRQKIYSAHFLYGRAIPWPSN